MRMIVSKTLLTLACMLAAAVQSSPAQDNPLQKFPKPLEIKLDKFSRPSDDEKKLIEQWLLELDLVPMIADQVAFVATGTYFFGGKSESEKHIANLRQYCIGWSLDNQADCERLLVINQRLLNPNVVDQGKWRLMQSDTAELDRLRIHSIFHEANGSSIYPPGPKSLIQDSLERANTFFPTRATTSSPTGCWAGRAMDRSKPVVTIDKLKGIQKVGHHSVALFEFRPADYYVYFIALSFLDTSPVQFDSWRQFRREQDISNKSPTPEQIQEEDKFLRSDAQHVARVQSVWQRLGDHRVPVAIQGATLDDVYDIELTAEIQWFVNRRVNPESFKAESLRQLGPFSVARE